MADPFTFVEAGRKVSCGYRLSGMVVTKEFAFNDAGVNKVPTQIWDALLKRKHADQPTPIEAYMSAKPPIIRVLTPGQASELERGERGRSTGHGVRAIDPPDLNRMHNDALPQTAGARSIMEQWGGDKIESVIVAADRPIPTPVR